QPGRPRPARRGRRRGRPGRGRRRDRPGPVGLELCREVAQQRGRALNLLRQRRPQIGHPPPGRAPDVLPHVPSRPQLHPPRTPPRSRSPPTPPSPELRLIADAAIPSPRPTDDQPDAIDRANGESVAPPGTARTSPSRSTAPRQPTSGGPPVTTRQHACPGT